MLRAYENMPAEEFIEQLRTFVIALGLGTPVVDQIDRVEAFDEDAHAEELTKVEDEATTSGRTEMKQEIIEAVTRWLEEQPNYDLIAAPCEALLAVIEAQ